MVGLTQRLNDFQLSIGYLFFDSYILKTLCIVGLYLCDNHESDHIYNDVLGASNSAKKQNIGCLTQKGSVKIHQGDNHLGEFSREWLSLEQTII